MGGWRRVGGGHQVVLADYLDPPYLPLLQTVHTGVRGEISEGLIILRTA
jgi:hypothetical protein